MLVTPGAQRGSVHRPDHRVGDLAIGRPARWVIVSDGSTDRTDEIVQSFAARHDWIELHAHAGTTVTAVRGQGPRFNAGLRAAEDNGLRRRRQPGCRHHAGPGLFRVPARSLRGVSRSWRGRHAFRRGHEPPDLHTYAHDAANIEHVSGACQLFRRACFEQVGGYIPVKGGAIDWIAVTTARMKGWRTRTFLDKVCFHHREIGTGSSGTLAARFHYGRKAYYVGGHPAWELLRGVFQMRRKPLLVGGLCFTAGYLWAAAPPHSSPGLSGIDRLPSGRTDGPPASA